MKSTVNFKCAGVGAGNNIFGAYLYKLVNKNIRSLSGRFTSILSEQDVDDLVHEVSCNIIASGGVAVLKDILNLSDLDIYGAISGKAIYSGTLDLKQAIEMTRKI